MKKNLFNVLLFAAGAAIGSAVTWKFVKTKYERIAQEEIDSVKETWARRNLEESCDIESKTENSDECEEEEEDEGFGDEDMATYARLIDMYNKPGNNVETEQKGEGDVPYINGPYVITPDDFGNGDYDHDMYCLTYYSDGVLANDWDEVLDLDETIGEDSIEHFGDYAEDVVHVRNERLRADYEVVRDDRSYTELIANNPLTRQNAN